ncbi:hypothetical protein Tco_0910732 [Tanacetum coccineum]|uniref:Uncharacterized protein n=1 Tax=Tanacetum coccineum TaxID=301880 RepID=A0ABQ5CVF1_9ASTR
MGQMLFPNSVPDTELVLYPLQDKYGTNALSKFSPDTELVLYPLQDKLTSGDMSLDLSAFKLSRLFFSLLSSGLHSLSTALLNARVFLVDSGCTS